MDKLSYVSNAGIEFMDSLYQDYKTDPQTVDADWRRFFEGFELGQANFSKNKNGKAGGASSEQLTKEINVLNLINGYRSRGHLFATNNPIFPPRPFKPTLDIENFGLEAKDLEETFVAGTEIGMGPAKLKDIVAHLKQTYCGNIGAEYKYIRHPEIVKWLEDRMDRSRNTPNFGKEEKKEILLKLGQASSFENFLHRKFVGQKRFSLEGAEAAIPALDGIINHGAALGVSEFVIGMAHRGRLNVLTNIMRKEYDVVFGEFVGKGLSDEKHDGDVKYHMGFSSDIEVAGNKVHLSLAPNPSHLEAVNPVVAGMARAKMDEIYGQNNDKICAILVHGDASVAGQGIVYECIQMSTLKGYEVGGTVHLVINNQVGFTTDPHDSRSSTYCTDVGKVTLCPVFHVNGDDPEAVLFVTKLAMEFRQAFKRDVFIDVVCYRRYGHNEGDEPRFTQPLMYKNIDAHKGPFDVYSSKLQAENVISADELKALETRLNDHLNKEFDESRVNEYKLDTTPKRSWQGLTLYDNEVLEANPDTKVAEKTLKTLTEKITTLPVGFKAHRNISKLVEGRKEMVAKTNKLDWGMAEHLAFASILAEGRHVRVSGQDCERGTFAHRHAVVSDIETGEKYSPLKNLSPDQGQFTVINSLLSEYAVMGFELGYAMGAPKGLTIWEAQYGDFVNGAQIIIDQFLSASKSKWQRLSGLVLLLPHGYEGGGPEHSSARPERFFTLCAENNMYVANLTTPANLFHALRRQVTSTTRRPLVVFSPKSLLRLADCWSPLEDLTKGSFQEVIDDAAADVKQVTRVVFCTGKLYYDLQKQRDALKKADTAIVRIEQLYPLPQAQLDAVVKKYKGAKQYIWAQEEPENMGAWSFLLRKFRSVHLDLVSRKEASSPATGTGSQHTSQQEYIIKKTLDLAPDAKLV